MKLNIDRSTLNFWTDKEKKVEAAHFLDLCEDAIHEERVVTPFLGSAMILWLKNILKGTNLSYLDWGGFDESERVRFVLNGSGEEPSHDDAEVVLIQAIPNKKDLTLSHRDILGSLLGLGIEREVLGDIRQGEKGSIVAVTSQIKDYILNNWDSVGREGIKVSIYNTSNNILPVAGLEKRIVTASLRIDGIAASGFGVSRTEMQEYIRQGKVKRNDIITLKPETEVRAEDIISCRGKGRLKVIEEDSKTKKGKFAWRIFIYKDNK